MSSNGRSLPLRAGSGMEQLSFGQQRLWFFEQLVPGQSVYNQHNVYRVRGPLDVDALEKCFTEIVRRHESLRTSFVSSNRDYFQVVNAAGPVPLPIDDLSGVSPDLREAEIERAIRREIRILFDLKSGPLLRPRLLRLGDQDHVLMWTIHHIASDGWSMKVLRGEVSTLYDAFAQDQPSPLPPLKVQYSDFSAWQRTRLDGVNRERLVNYWRDALKDVPQLLELPTDRSRPAGVSFRGERLAFALSAELSARIKSLALQERVTPFMVLLSAFQVLLFRYSGQSSLQIGTPIAGRSHPDLERNIGLFINFLSISANFTDGMTVGEFLKQVRATCLGAYEHQDLPFEMLVEELQPDRSMSHHPLVQVLFALQSGFTDELPLAGLQTTRIFVGSETSVFDLEAYLRGDGDRFTGAFVFNSDMWNTSTINRMIVHYQQILESIVCDLNQKVSELSVLTGDEKRRLETDWCVGRSESISHRSAHRRFEDCAARSPSARSVVFEGQTLHYGELNRRANRLAHHLIAEGATRETRIGVFLERSLDSLVALLAVLKSGATYLPLDPAEPFERLKAILLDAEIELAITRAPLRDRLPVQPARVVELDSASPLIAAQPEQNPQVEFDDAQAAYVIYTSGSTGVPNGVVVEHRALSAFHTAMAAEPGLSNTDHLLSVTPVTFDISLLELLLPLTVGASLEIVSRSVTRSAGELRQRLESSGATIMQATPMTWRMLIKAGWQGSRQLTILCGGEALQQDLAKSLIERGGRVWNMYGPTETTIWSTLKRISTPDDSRSIGRPIANTRVYVLDPSQQLTPFGVPGELYIGGAGLARGYHRRHALTEERFIPDPFRPGQRIYRTGDRVRWSEDGTLEFFGRLDSQIKFRGHRIELSEIESSLLKHPAVEGAGVVLNNAERTGQPSLVGYWTRRADSTIDEDSLRQFLATHLPPYMLPAQLVRLDHMPLTPSGKINRRELKTRAVEARPNVKPPASSPVPASAHQRLVGQIWKELLRQEDFDPKADFFHLGGNSLLAFQMVARLREQLGLEIPLSTMFEATTLEAFSTALEKLESEAKSPDKPGAAEPIPAVAADGTVDRPPTHRLSQSGQRYLETLRHGTQPTVLVWVGQLRGMMEFQTKVAVTSTLVWMKMDGLHTDRFEDIPIQERGRRYARELMTAYPAHRFFVAGYCLSGLSAHALATELQHQGSNVPALILFEPTVPPHEFEARRAALRKEPSNGHPATHHSGAGPLPRLLRKARFKLRFTAERLVCRLAKQFGRPIPTRFRWNYYFPSLYGAARYYDLRPFDGRIGLIGGTGYCDAWQSLWASNALHGLTTLRIATARHTDLFNEQSSREWAPWLDDFIRTHTTP